MSTYEAEPFVVALDLESERNARDTAALLREIIGHWPYGRTHFAGGSSHLTMLAEQIEAALPRPRIPEPGLWGVVEAGHAHLEDGRRSKFVRVSLTGRYQWVEHEAEADWSTWDRLVDPVLIRDGVEDQS